MDKLLTMSDKELSRLEVMQRLDKKRLKQREAAGQLGVSLRHVKRLLRRYRREGAAGLVSKRRGRPANNRLDAKVRKQAVRLIRKRYSDFGPTLAHEKLTEVHGLQVSVESVRQLMIGAELWKPRRAKRARVHQMRARRPCFGELVQMDGSPFDWFEGRAPACSLLVFIDDATGRLLELYFTPQESFFSYCAALRRYFARWGKPLAFYSDKHGIFRVNAKNAVSGTGMTQFGRALQELDIQSICANTPQAKGRVERANQTLQDRLVKEMRLQRISGIEAANQFTPTFLDDFNQRFAVVPASPSDLHRPLLPADDLDRIFTRQVTRTLSKNLTLQHNKVVYQIQTSRPGYALRSARVLVHESADGEITIRYKGRQLEYTVFNRQQRQAEVVSSKSLEQKLRKPTRPAADHPWRTYGQRMNGESIAQHAQSG